MTAQAFTNFSGQGGANQPTNYVSADGFVGAPVAPFNPNSPTFAAASFPSGTTGGSTTATSLILTGSSTGKTTVNSGLASTSSNTLTLPITATDTLAALGTVQTFTAAQTFTNSDLLLLGSLTGATTFTSLNAGASNFTASVPAVSGALAMTSGSNLFIADVYRCTTIQTANANVTPATVTGLVSNTLPIGTYRFRLALYTTVAAGGGLQINLLLTTTVMGVGNFVSTALLAASMSCAGATSVTSPISLYTGATTVPIAVMVEGTFTVTTAGTVTVQMCQGTSNASNSSVNVGSTMELTRIA